MTQPWEGVGGEGRRTSRCLEKTGGNRNETGECDSV